MESQVQKVLPLKALQKNLGSKCLSRPPQGLPGIGRGQLSQYKRVPRLHSDVSFLVRINSYLGPEVPKPHFSPHAHINLPRNVFSEDLKVCPGLGPELIKAAFLQMAKFYRCLPDRSVLCCNNPGPLPGDKHPFSQVHTEEELSRRGAAPEGRRGQAPSEGVSAVICH